MRCNEGVLGCDPAVPGFNMIIPAPTTPQPSAENTTRIYSLYYHGGAFNFPGVWMGWPHKLVGVRTGNHSGRCCETETYDRVISPGRRERQRETQIAREGERGKNI